MADGDQSRTRQAYQAAKTAKQIQQIAKTGRAAALLANPYVWIAVVVGTVVILLVLMVGVAIAGLSGSNPGGTQAGGAQGGAAGGDVSESGNALRQAFLSQKNITYQQAVIQEEIRDGGVVDNVLRAVLAAARTPGIGNLAVSAAGCRSHSNSGGLHCPTTPSQALDIGSAGTTHLLQVNKVICETALKDGNPYKVNELFGEANPGCVLDGGKPTSSNPDPPNHVHVGVFK